MDAEQQAYQSLKARVMTDFKRVYRVVDKDNNMYHLLIPGHSTAKYATERMVNSPYFKDMPKGLNPLKKPMLKFNGQKLASKQDLEQLNYPPGYSLIFRTESKQIGGFYHAKYLSASGEWVRTKIARKYEDTPETLINEFNAEKLATGEIGTPISHVYYFNSPLEPTILLRHVGISNNDTLVLVNAVGEKDNAQRTLIFPKKSPAGEVPNFEVKIDLDTRLSVLTSQIAQMYCIPPDSDIFIIYEYLIRTSPTDTIKFICCIPNHGEFVLSQAFLDKSRFFIFYNNNGSWDHSPEFVATKYNRRDDFCRKLNPLYLDKKAAGGGPNPENPPMRTQTMNSIPAPVIDYNAPRPLFESQALKTLVSPTPVVSTFNTSGPSMSVQEPSYSQPTPSVPEPTPSYAYSPPPAPSISPAPIPEPAPAPIPEPIPEPQPSPSSSYGGYQAPEPTPSPASSYNAYQAPSVPEPSTPSYGGYKPPETPSYGGYKPPEPTPAPAPEPTPAPSYGGYKPPEAPSYGGYKPPEAPSYGGYKPPETPSYGGYKPPEPTPAPAPEPTPAPSYGGYKPPETPSYGGYKPPETPSYGGYKPPEPTPAPAPEPTPAPAPEPTPAPSYGGYKPPEAPSFGGYKPPEPTPAPSYGGYKPPEPTPSYGGYKPPEAPSYGGYKPPEPQAPSYGGYQPPTPSYGGYQPSTTPSYGGYQPPTPSYGGYQATTNPTEPKPADASQPSAPAYGGYNFTTSQNQPGQSPYGGYSGYNNK